MADRNDRPEHSNRRGGRKGRKKVCSFCTEKIDTIDHKNVAKLRRFTSEYAKTPPRRATGICAHHQHELTITIERSHHIALPPFSSDWPEKI